jgi:CRP/FNR family transcriptional regulator
LYNPLNITHKADTEKEAYTMSIALPTPGSISLAAARNPACSSLEEVTRLLGTELPAANLTPSPAFHHRRVKPGEFVCRAGEAFEALYVVNCGFLKTVTGDEYGNERVLSFPMKGSLLGCDGICDDRHTAEVVALTDCDLIVLPFKQLLSIGRVDIALEHLIHRVISREIMSEHAHLATLSALPSDARVARFLALQGQRHAAMGYSPHCFILRMTRREIGSYLGLTLETVSRALSALDAQGVAKVDQRNIEILKPDVLYGAAKTIAPAASRVPPSRWAEPLRAAA